MTQGHRINVCFLFIDIFYNMKKNINKALDIVIAVLIVALTAAASNIFVRTNSEWYKELIKPDYYPSPAVFTAAWIIIYIIMAVVLSKMLLNNASKKTVILFIVQCILQILWCLFFFTLYMPLVALFILISLVIINNVITILLMDKDEISGWLYFVVFVWTVYACTLNYAIVMLN